MIRMMVIAGVCAGFLSSAAASAQSLHKCTDPQGRNSYQSTPCSDSQLQVWTRDMPAASQSSTSAPRRVAETATVKRKVPLSSTRTVRSGSKKPSGSRGSGAAISMHNDAAACEKAKERRRKTYEKLGLNRSFETSRKMDDLVYQACR